MCKYNKFLKADSYDMRLDFLKNQEILIRDIDTHFYSGILLIIQG